MRCFARESANAEEYREEDPDLLKEVGVDEVIEVERIVSHHSKKPRWVVILRVLDQISMPVGFDPAVGKREEPADGECDDHGREESRARLEPGFVNQRFVHD